jgi:hypothetical protein
MFNRDATDTNGGAPLVLVVGMGGGGSDTKDSETKGFASICSIGCDIPPTGGVSEVDGGDGIFGSSWLLSGPPVGSTLSFLDSRGSSWQRWPMLLLTQRVHGRTTCTIRVLKSSAGVYEDIFSSDFPVAKHQIIFGVFFFASPR